MTAALGANTLGLGTMQHPVITILRRVLSALDAHSDAERNDPESLACGCGIIQIETFASELCDHGLPFRVASVWVPLDAVEFRPQTDDNEIAGGSCPAAVEFHREEEGRFRDSAAEVFCNVK